MALFLASDHGGFELKEEIKKYLDTNKIDYKDLGTNTSESVDYPDYAKKVADEINNADGEGKGILVCGTGIGISIAANKFRGIRAALCGDSFSAKMSRLHNNANILVLGGRVTGSALGVEIVDIWLNTPFEGGRHQKRLDKITAFEN
ncbi:MAG: ribose 5-phosphate isomerase B [Nitrospinae bacterium]|nr:ribose 5-phosphate isomerase B [Nitrospinota bacterium]